jgi:DNA-binding HxlR family transcriptional regulator
MVSNNVQQVIRIDPNVRELLKKTSKCEHKYLSSLIQELVLYGIIYREKMKKGDENNECNL